MTHPAQRGTDAPFLVEEAYAPEEPWNGSQRCPVDINASAWDLVGRILQMEAASAAKTKTRRSPQATAAARQPQTQAAPQPAQKARAAPAPVAGPPPEMLTCGWCGEQKAVKILSAVEQQKLQRKYPTTVFFQDYMVPMISVNDPLLKPHVLNVAGGCVPRWQSTPRANEGLYERHYAKGYIKELAMGGAFPVCYSCLDCIVTGNSDQVPQTAFDIGAMMAQFR